MVLMYIWIYRYSYC